MASHEKKPIDMLEEEKPLLQAFYSSVKEEKNLKEEKILVIWRDAKSNDELNAFFSKMDFTVYDREFDTIYVNGDNNLANLKKDEEHFKVKLIEEEFKSRMFGE